MSKTSSSSLRIAVPGSHPPNWEHIPTVLSALKRTEPGNKVQAGLAKQVWAVGGLQDIKTRNSRVFLLAWYIPHPLGGAQPDEGQTEVSEYRAHDRHTSCLYLSRYQTV